MIVRNKTILISKMLYEYLSLLDAQIYVSITLLLDVTKWTSVVK